MNWLPGVIVVIGCMASSVALGIAGDAVPSWISYLALAAAGHLLTIVPTSALSQLNTSAPTNPAVKL